MAKTGKSRMTAEELGVFCAELALLMEKGLPLYDSVETLAQTCEGTPRGERMKRISDVVLETGSLREALSREKDWPEPMIGMIGAGERTGRLRQVLAAMADGYDRENRQYDAMLSAATYPIVLSSILLATLFLLLWLALPVFGRVLNSVGISSGAYVRFGYGIGAAGLAAFGVLVLVILFSTLAIRLGRRETMLGAFGALFGPLRRATKKLAASSMLHVFGMAEGLPQQETIDLALGVVSDRASREKLEEMRSRVDEGATLGEAFAESGLIDQTHALQARVALENGAGAETLEKLATLYGEQAERAIGSFVSIVEPTLIALICVVIGAALLAVTLPLASVVTGIL